MTLKFSAKNGECIQEESIGVDLQTVRRRSRPIPLGVTATTGLDRVACARAREEGRHCRDKGHFIIAVLSESSNGRRASICIYSPFVDTCPRCTVCFSPACRLRIIPVLDLDRMTKTSTGRGIRKTHCCIGRSLPISKRFSLASKNAAARFRSLSNARCGPICLVACWPAVFCGSSVSPAARIGSCRCLAKADPSVRPVAEGEWPIPRRTWWIACFPMFRHASGFSRCRSPCATVWPMTRRW